MDVPMCFQSIDVLLPYSLCCQCGCTGVSGQDAAIGMDICVEGWRYQAALTLAMQEEGVPPKVTRFVLASKAPKRIQAAQGISRKRQRKA